MPTRSGHPGPTISYQDAMQLQIEDEDGKPVRVFECHPSVFRRVLYAAIEQHPNCNDIKGELRTLLFRYRPDKWYGITVLARYGVDFPPGKPPEQDEEAVLKSLWVQPD